MRGIIISIKLTNALNPSLSLFQLQQVQHGLRYEPLGAAAAAEHLTEPLLYGTGRWSSVSGGQQQCPNVQWAWCTWWTWSCGGRWLCSKHHTGYRSTLSGAHCLRDGRTGAGTATATYTGATTSHHTHCPSGSVGAGGLDAWGASATATGNTQISYSACNTRTDTRRGIQCIVRRAAQAAAHTAARQEALQDRDPQAGHLLHSVFESRPRDALRQRQRLQLHQSAARRHVSYTSHRLNISIYIDKHIPIYVC